MDIIGNSARYPLYAPCDCHLIYQDSVGNTRGYQSDNEAVSYTHLTLHFPRKNPHHLSGAGV